MEESDFYEFFFTLTTGYMGLDIFRIYIDSIEVQK